MRVFSIYACLAVKKEYHSCMNISETCAVQLPAYEEDHHNVKSLTREEVNTILNNLGTSWEEQHLAGYAIVAVDEASDMYFSAPTPEALKKALTEWYGNTSSRPDLLILPIE